MEQKRSKIIKIVVYSIISAVIAVFLLLQIFFPKAAIDIFGFKLYLISYTGSMEPVLEYNDLILVKKFDFYKLQQGDIITFATVSDTGKKITVTHQVIDILTYSDGSVYLRTKGVNLPKADAFPVTVDGNDDSNMYLGKYVGKSAFFGNLFAFLKSPLGIVCIAVNGGGAYVVWWLLNKRKPDGDALADGNEMVE